ncbi:MAG: S1 RNA-binding domain-containing protein [Anaerolineae bacterium]
MRKNGIKMTMPDNTERLATTEQHNQAEDAHEKQPTSIKDLKPRMRLRGKVTKVGLSGAFVDIGLSQDGWVHISQLSQDPINKVTEVVKEGSEVTVWVRKVDRRRGRISLTMIEPPKRTLHDLKPGMIIEGKVTRLAPFGAFVDIGIGRDGLVHVSELAPGYVEDPSEIVSVGEEVEVKVLNVNRGKRQIELSMKEIPLEEIEGEEPLPTIMELAIQEAFDQQRNNRGKKAKRGEKRPPRSEQNDIITRTLRSHRN